MSPTNSPTLLCSFLTSSFTKYSLLRVVTSSSHTLI